MYPLVGGARYTHLTYLLTSARRPPSFAKNHVTTLTYRTLWPYGVRAYCCRGARLCPGRRPVSAVCARRRGAEAGDRPRARHATSRPWKDGRGASGWRARERASECERGNEKKICFFFPRVVGFERTTFPQTSKPNPQTLSSMNLPASLRSPGSSGRVVVH